MSAPLHVVQSASHSHRYESELDGAPFSQLERTMVFTLWERWGRPGQRVVLTIVTTDADPDDRLVNLEETPGDPNEGKWELRLKPADTSIEEGMYKYTVWSTADADSDDSLELVSPSNFYVEFSGREV